ncbi:MAG: hypothetical protein H7067_01040, partial [Burkholderiales bacterium]|nr:hypothetical protein [Opitutaceae bacterium]
RPGQRLALTLNNTALETRPDLGLLEGWRHPVHPFRVPVPAALLRPGANTLTISAADPAAAALPADSQIISARLELRHESAIASP